MNQKNEWWRMPEFKSFFEKAAPKNGGNATAGAAPAIGGQQQYGFTGNGKDGVSQPDRSVNGMGNGSYGVHETEYVFSAPATQAIGPDVLDATMKKAESGELDVNALRNVVGIPEKPGFQQGGRTPGYQQGGMTRNRQAQPGQLPGSNVPMNPNDLNKNIGLKGEMSSKTRGPIPSGGPKPFNPHGGIVPNKIPGITPTIPNQGGFIPGKTPIPQPFGTNKNPNISQSAEKFKLNKMQNIPVNPNVTPDDPDSVVINPNITDPVTVANPDVQNLDVVGPNIPNVDPNVIEELNQNGINQNDILDYINGIMTGDNPYFQTLKNALGQDIAGAGAAATAAMKQEATQAGLNAGQVATIGMARQRDVESRSSKALGDLTAQQQFMGMDAAQQLLQQSNWQQNFDEMQSDKEFQKQWDQAQLAIQMGDFEGVNKIFESIGLDPIDFDKFESIQTANATATAIQNMLSVLGPDADPKLLGMLGGMLGSAYQNMFNNMNISNGIVDNGDGTQTDLNELINGINDGTLDPNQTNTVLSIGENTQAWLDNTMSGELFKSSVTSTPAGQTLMDEFAAGSEKAAKEYGALITSYIKQDSGGKINQAQKDLLEKYDLYDADMDLDTLTWDDVADVDTKITNAIEDGDEEKAQKIYDSLTDAKKKLIGPLGDYVQKYEDHNKIINTLTQGTYDDVIKSFPAGKDDPIYQELLTHDNTIQDIGKSKQFEYSGGGNDRYGFSSLGTTKEPKVKAGDIVNVDGNLLIFKEMKTKDKSGTDQTIYFFYDPLTKETKKIKAAKGKTGWTIVT